MTYKFSYELAKQLKDAGFPQKENPTYLGHNGSTSTSTFDCYIPTLSELIEACGKNFSVLQLADIRPNTNQRWSAHSINVEFGKGKTPEEAVAKLWLALNEKKND